MNGKRWKQSATTVSNIGYHFIWCPKYRRKALPGKVANRQKELLVEKAGQIQVEIAQMEIMPDHVHLFAKATPTNSFNPEPVDSRNTDDSVIDHYAVHCNRVFSCSNLRELEQAFSHM